MKITTQFQQKDKRLAINNKSNMSHNSQQNDKQPVNDNTLNMSSSEEVRRIRVRMAKVSQYLNE
jgi:hypothetical protein